MDAAALAAVVIPGLRAGLASIDSKQPETVIGELLNQRMLTIILTSTFTAQAVGHESWQAIWDMVKGVSEIMLSSAASNGSKVGGVFTINTFNNMC